MHKDTNVRSMLRDRLIYIDERLVVLKDEEKALRRFRGYFARDAEPNSERHLKPRVVNDRRALRAAGRTREIYEILAIVSPMGRGLTARAVAEALAASHKKVAVTLRSHARLGFLRQDGHTYRITDAGHELRERSARYGGRSLRRAIARVVSGALQQ